MYCPKCGKQVPDNVAFCSHCGAKLKGGAIFSGQSNNTASIGWIICLSLSALSLFWAYHLYAREADFLGFYDYMPPYSPYETEVLFFCGLGVIGLIVGIVGLCYANKSAPNPANSKAEPQLKAKKLPIQGHGSVIKCSHCEKVQTSNRTTCQSCGAKFVE